MTNEVCLARLREKRRRWKRGHPIGFHAVPRKKDGALDMMHWEVVIPGKKGTPWYGGVYKMLFIFPEDYPSKPPKCQFTPPIFHANVYDSGTVCLNILDPEKNYSPRYTIEHLVLGIQELLNKPNVHDPAQKIAYDILRKDKKAYDARIKKLCLTHRPPLPLNPTKKQLPKGVDGAAEAEEDVPVKEEQVSSDGIEKENLEVTEWRGHRGPRLVNEQGRLL